MAKGKEIENGTRRRSRAKDSKIKDKGQSQSNKGKNKKNSKSRSLSRVNGDCIDNNEKPEVITVPDSENDDGDEEEEIVQDEGIDFKEEEANTPRDSNKVENGDGKEKQEVTKKNGKRKKSDSDDSCQCFPMNRITRIIKSEDADIRITQESVFLVNKATEKFLELFCKEAYSCALLDSKNQVWYEHLSSVVSKQKGFDFLLDIVPEKVKAEDALAEMSLAET